MIEIGTHAHCLIQIYNIGYRGVSRIFVGGFPASQYKRALLRRSIILANLIISLLNFD